MSERIITGKVRLSYCNIWETNKDGKYSVSVLIPKTDTVTLKKIERAVSVAKEEGKKKHWSGKIPANLKLPLRDGDEERPDDEAYVECYFFNASSKYQPEVVDRDMQPILERTDVYSGCYARVSVNFYPFNREGNRGVACGLGNIQKWEDGDKLSGGASAVSDFGTGDVNSDFDETTW